MTRGLPSLYCPCGTAPQPATARNLRAGRLLIRRRRSPYTEPLNPNPSSQRRRGRARCGSYLALQGRALLLPCNPAADRRIYLRPPWRLPRQFCCYERTGDFLSLDPWKPWPTREGTGRPIRVGRLRRIAVVVLGPVLSRTILHLGCLFNFVLICFFCLLEWTFY
jgi:hypothetical protein